MIWLEAFLIFVTPVAVGLIVQGGKWLRLKAELRHLKWMELHGRREGDGNQPTKTTSAQRTKKHREARQNAHLGLSHRVDDAVMTMLTSKEITRRHRLRAKLRRQVEANRE